MNGKVGPSEQGSDCAGQDGRHVGSGEGVTWRERGGCGSGVDAESVDAGDVS